MPPQSDGVGHASRVGILLGQRGAHDAKLSAQALERLLEYGQASALRSASSRVMLERYPSTPQLELTVRSLESWRRYRHILSMKHRGVAFWA